MFTKAGIKDLHHEAHQSLDLLMRHVATVPEHFWRQSIAGFGFPTISQQLVHILNVEEAWVHALQCKDFRGWSEENARSGEALFEHKGRIEAATRVYLDGLTEEELNLALPKRPKGWFGRLRSPAFIVLHVITHMFHHKGQVVAMLRMLGYPAPDTDLQRG
jgi:uncharacterized damage-inducible protein DinB